VVDIGVTLRPFSPGIVELLMTGTAAYHPRLFEGATAQQVTTSELTGEELWNLAKIGYTPVELVMATSVYSLGIMGGIGAAFSGLAKGEIPELTQLIYEARENCLELLRKDAERLGAERVIGARLHVRELSPGLIEIIALGTAVRPAQDMTPQTPNLIPQAVITEGETFNLGTGAPGLVGALAQAGAARRQGNPLFALIAFFIMIMGFLIPMCLGLSHHR
jgi:uncharacterized protein YbjQ (UPF0145 family)